MTRNQVLFLCAFLWAAFVPFAIVVERQALFDVVNSLGVTLGGLVMFVGVVLLRGEVLRMYS